MRVLDGDETEAATAVASCLLVRVGVALEEQLDASFVAVEAGVVECRVSAKVQSLQVDVRLCAKETERENVSIRNLDSQMSVVGENRSHLS